MADLPLLVVHGALIAKLAVVVLAAAGLVALTQRRRRAERRRTRDAVAARSVALTGLAPGFASLRGRLEGTACTLTEIEGFSGDAGHHRSELLVVDVAGERVELTGDVRVVRGTVATAGWRAMPPGTPSVLTQDTRRGPRRLFSIGDGAEVVAQGVLERRAADTGYRDDAGTWVMRPALGEPAIELVAMRPMSLPIPLGPIRLAVWAAVFLACSYATLHVIGSQIIDHHRDEDAAPLSVRAQLAAALPGARTTALSHLWWQIRQAPRTAATLAQTRQLVELRDGCAGQAAWLIDQEQYEDVLATTHGCAPQAELQALARLGRYAEAADLIAAHPDLMHNAPMQWVTIEIGAGRWREAALAADAVVRSLDHEPASSGFLASLDRKHLAHARCVAAWFRVLAGDRAAPEELTRLAVTGNTPGCLLADALQQSGEPRARGLANVREADGYGDDGRLARALQWLDGDQDKLPLLATRLVTFSVDPWVWLAPQTAPKDGDSAARRDDLHARRAVHAMLAGDTIAALAEALAVVGDRRAEIVAMIELHTPSTSFPWTDPPYGDEELGREIALRRGQMRAAPYIIGDCMVGVEAALPAAIAGDGGPLATAISTRCDGMPSIIELVLGVAPRVVRHRAELAEALRLYNGQLYTHDDLPFQYIEYAGFRRDLLLLTGEAAAAKRWQARVDGQLTMLADRQRTLAFLLWQL
jgi:hypothetical protein